MEITELLKKVRKIEIKSRKIVDNLFMGEYHSAFKGSGIEFSEVREYQYGDDIRSIDWKVTSRMNSPYVKVYHEERELTVYIILDLSTSMFFATRNQLKRDIATELAAIFSFSAISNNDKVGLITFSDKVDTYIKPSKGKKHALKIIREIINFEPKEFCQNTQLDQALEFLNDIQKKKSIIFLISDFFATKYNKQLKYVSRKHDLVPVILQDPVEVNFPKSGHLNFVDLENNKTQVINTNSKNWNNWISNRCAKRNSQLDKLFKEAKIKPLLINTAKPYLHEMVQYFEGRKR